MTIIVSGFIYLENNKNRSLEKYIEYGSKLLKLNDLELSRAVESYSWYIRRVRQAINKYTKTKQRTQSKIHQSDWKHFWTSGEGKSKHL